MEPCVIDERNYVTVARIVNESRLREPLVAPDASTTRWGQLAVDANFEMIHST
jgi:hypothetical protein